MLLFLLQPCPPNPHCGANYELVELQDDERNEIVRVHNELRNQVALGEFNNFPNATNMEVMVNIKKKLFEIIPRRFLKKYCYQSYSKELEFIAQCRSNNCIVGGARDLCFPRRKEIRQILKEKNRADFF